MMSRLSGRTKQKISNPQLKILQNIALEKLLINKMWRFVALPPLYKGETPRLFLSPLLDLRVIKRQAAGGSKFTPRLY